MFTNTIDNQLIVTYLINWQVCFWSFSSVILSSCSHGVLAHLSDLIRSIWTVLHVVTQTVGGQTARLVHTEILPHSARVVGYNQSSVADQFVCLVATVTHSIAARAEIHNQYPLLAQLLQAEIQSVFQFGIFL